MSNEKDEFVAKLDGTYYSTLKRAFAYAYRMGYRDGIYQDLDQKNAKRLDREFKKFLNVCKD